MILSFPKTMARVVYSRLFCESSASASKQLAPHIPPLHFLIKRFHAASSRSGLNRHASRPQCDFNRVRNSESLSARAIKRANPRVSPVEKYPA
jgi:hypothetical protein